MVVARQAVITEPFKAGVREVKLADPGPNQILLAAEYSAVSAGPELAVYTGTHQWLADPNLALLSVIIVGVWQQFPFLMITVLAALSGIPDDVNEAASIDGASRFQTFRYITFPLILPISIIATLLQAIWTFNNFGLPFVLTGGGPANATTPLILLAYKEAFQHFDIGYGTALAVISMVLMLALGAIYLRQQASQGVYQ